MSVEEFYSGRYIVIGPPGTGKTTFLSGQVKKVVERFSGGFSASAWPNPVLICSLTRAAAAEVAGRNLPIQRSAVGTLHAHCFRALNFPKIISGEHVAAWNNQSAYPLGSTDFGGDDQTGEETAWDRRADVRVETDGDSLLQRMEILRHCCVPKDKWDRNLIEFATEWDQFKSANGVMDFTDLIEVALQTVQTAPGRPAVIMVDEAQDLSALEYALIRSWGDNARATIVVGDPWQALYTWRGADPSLFSDPTVPDVRKRVLSQSYRVPANVLQVAFDWVKDHLSTYEPIEYSPRRPSACETEIESLGECGWRESTIHDTDDIVEECRELVDQGKSVMFQTSCSYMLNGLIGNLRRKSIPFCNPWRKYRKDWNPLSGSGSGMTMTARMLAFVAPCVDNTERRDWTIKDVSRFIEPMAVTGTLNRGAKKEIYRLAGLDEDGKANEHGDRHGDGHSDEHGDRHGDGHGDTQSESDFLGDETPMTIDERSNAPIYEEDLENWFDNSVLQDVVRIWRGDATIKEAVEWWHDHLLGKPKKVAEYPMGVLISSGVGAIKTKPRVFVGTIHSFKGAEADVTYIFPDLSAAGFRQWGSGEGALRDEVVRLFYVALTRARSRAFICRNASYECAPIRRFVLKHCQ